LTISLQIFLVSKNHRFLLARLYFDDVQNQVTEADIERTLEKFEKRAGKEDLLAAAYDEAIERIKSQPKKFARLAQKVLGWISCAKRPLTKVELQHALAVQQNASVFNHKDIPGINDIISACAGLVTEENKFKIRLSHYTTQEYIKQQTRQHKSWFSTAETEIARTCMKYLSFKTSLPLIEEAERTMSFFPMFGPIKIFRGFDFIYPLFSYALDYWAYHAYRAALPPEETLKTVEFFLPENRFGKPKLKYKKKVPRPKLNILKNAPTTLSRWERLLHLAAYFGLPGLVKLLLMPNGYYSNGTADIRITPLCCAAREGHKATVQELLKHSAIDVNEYDEKGKTPVLLALGKGYVTIATLLLADKRFDFKSVHKTGEKALRLAISEGYAGVVSCLINAGIEEFTTEETNLTPLTLAVKAGHQPIVEILLAAGADTNARNPSGMTPLAYAVEGGHKTIVQTLLREGADVNVVSSNETPLMCATKAGNHSIVETLLRANAEVNAGISIGRTALTLAAILGYQLIVGALLAAGADVDGGTLNGETPLIYASRAGHDSIVKTLLRANAEINAGISSGGTPLTFAAMEGHSSTVKLLLAANAMPNPKDAKGRTPIYWAANYGHDHVVKLFFPFKNAEDDGLLSEILCKEFRRGNFPVVTTLIVDGDVDPDHVLEGGLVLLHWALKSGHSVVVQHLLRRNLNYQRFKRRFGEYPLWIAANEGHCEIVEILLDKIECDVDLKSKILKRAFTKRYWAVAKLLLNDKRTEWRHQPQLILTSLMSAANGGTSEIIELLLCHLDVSFLNATDMNQQTSLHHAATHGHIMMIASLLRNPDILPNIKDRNGHTPLALAARNGHHQAVKSLLENETIRFNVDQTDGDGLTALALAAKNGYMHVVESLIGTSEVNPNTLDPNEQTALSLAAQKGHSEIVDLLLGYEGTDRLTKDCNGRTPLGFAIQNGWASVVKRLLEDNSIRKNVENGELEWGLYYTISEADTEILEVFIDMDIKY
jgi:ankyrin repeat protein